MKAIFKKSITTFALFAIVGLLFFPIETFSQGPPPWAPAKGYRAKTRHIYFPQQNFYYDIQKHHYLYLNNGNWLVSVAVPAPFISINLGSATQIQLDYYGAYPYYYNANHRVKYKTVKKVNKPKQNVIVVKEKHGIGHGNGKKHSGNGHGNGHGHGKKH